MEEVFHPDERKWISPLTHLGHAMEDLKRMVRLQKDRLLVSGIQNTVDIRPSNFNESEPDGFGPEGGRPRKNMAKPYLNEEASKIDEMDVPDEPESDTEKVKKQLELSSRNKWLDGDEPCAAAVQSVGGPGLFDTNKKKKKRKKKKDESDDDDDDEEDYEDYWIDDNMYQRYNYGGVGENAENIEGSQSQVSEAPFSLPALSQSSSGYDFVDLIFPEALISTEEVVDELQIYDDDADNYANWAEKCEEYRNKFNELLPGDSDESEDEEGNQRGTKFSDEEDNLENEDKEEEENVAQPENENQSPPSPVPGTSKSFRNAPPPSSSGSAIGKEKRNRKSSQSNPNSGNVEHYKAPDMDISTSEPTIPTEQEQGASGSQGSKTKENGPDLFKRFTDWVFLQSKRRDELESVKIRPSLMREFKMSEDEIKNLQQFTSASLATVKGEAFQDDPVLKATSMPVLAPPIHTSDTNLQSLTIFITHGDDPSNFPWKSVNVQQQMNDDFVYDQFVRRMEQQKLDYANPAKKPELVNKEEDFLVQILVYQATDPNDVLPDEIKTYVEPKLSYELHMLGSQTIADLMEAMHCENDYVYLQDVPHPDLFKEDPNEYAKKKFPSRMIVIQDIIYTDPSVENIDYSGILNAWASRPPTKNIGPFKNGSWEIQLKNLELRFGMPYLFSHLGGCEHIIVFTKARLLHLEDEHILKNYPKIIGIPRFKNVYCRVDNEYLAKWSVHDFKEFPENPMLLCTECVQMYCYDKQKKKRGNFKLYPFTQIANII